MAAHVLAVSVDVELLDPGVVIAAAAAMVVAIVLVVLAVGRRRARAGVLEERFGSEYRRLVDVLRSRRRVDEELTRRVERRAGYELRELDEDERGDLRNQWRTVQAGFVDGPEACAQAAVQLLTEAAAARGYPGEDVERCLDDVSVDHPELVADLRRAMASGGTTPVTERHRRIVLRVRALFDGLVGEREVQSATTEPVDAPPAVAPGAQGLAPGAEHAAKGDRFTGAGRDA